MKDPNRAPAPLELIEGGSRAGASPDWERAYRENVGWVYGYIYSRTGDRPDSEDLTAEVFVRAMPRLSSSASPEQLRSYLVTTARTVLADHWRRHYDVSLTWDLPAATAADALTRQDANVARANRLLDRLPDNYRRVLELRFLEGCSVREAAKRLGVSVANAKVLQHRALRSAAEHGVEELS